MPNQRRPLRGVPPNGSAVNAQEQRGTQLSETPRNRTDSGRGASVIQPSNATWRSRPLARNLRTGAPAGKTPHQNHPPQPQGPGPFVALTLDGPDLAVIRRGLAFSMRWDRRAGALLERIEQGLVLAQGAA